MKKIFKTILAGTSAVAMATPLVAIASCSKTTGVDDCTEYKKPSFEPIEEEVTPTGIRAVDGLKEYLEFLGKNPSAPIEEYRWMTSLLGGVLAPYIKKFNDETLIPKNAGYIHLNTFGSKMNNFSTKTDTNGDVLATYDVKWAADFDFSVDILKLLEEPEPSNEEELTAIVSGHLKPNITFSVKNVPLSTFVLKVPYVEEIIESANEEVKFPECYWLISPDLTNIDLKTNTEYGFTIGGNLDMSLDFNSQNLINFNNGIDIKLDANHHELFTFIEQMFSEELSTELIAVLKRFITLPCGWLSYAMSNTKHVVPIAIAEGNEYYGWNKGSRDLVNPEKAAKECDYEPFTIPVSATSPAKFSFTLKDDTFKYTEGNEETPYILTATIGQSESSIDFSPSAITNDIDCDEGVLDFDVLPIAEGDDKTITYDFVDAINVARRPNNGTYAANTDEQFRNVFLGKNWLYVTQPFDLVEQSDMLNTDGSNIDTKTLDYGKTSSGVIEETETKKYSIYNHSISISKSMYDYLTAHPSKASIHVNAFTEAGRRGESERTEYSDVIGVDPIIVDTDSEGKDITYWLRTETTYDDDGTEITKYYLDAPLALTWSYYSPADYTYPFTLYIAYDVSDVNPVWGEIVGSDHYQSLGNYTVKQGYISQQSYVALESKQPVTVDQISCQYLRPTFVTIWTRDESYQIDNVEFHDKDGNNINMVDGFIKASTYGKNMFGEKVKKSLYVKLDNGIIEIYEDADFTTKFTVTTDTPLFLYAVPGYNPEADLNNPQITITPVNE